MKYYGNEILDTMTKYARNRNNTIYSLILEAFNLTSTSEYKTILEFGAGKGEFIDRFTKFSNLTTYALEIDQTYLNILKKKHKIFNNINLITQKVDFIITIDVLEHINNDLEILKQLFRILKENGQLFIYVPARPELYSKFDKNIGHYRRYVLGELKSKVNKAGFLVEKVYYHDFLGYFAATFNKFTSNGGLSSSAVYIYDKFVFPFSKFLEKLFHCPFGKSIILIAKKTSK